MEENEKTAELVGAILGDGHLHTKNDLITIVGSLEDLDYYKDNLMPLFKENFGKEPALKRRNDRNAYYLLLSSKETMNFLTEKIGLKRGSKVNASVPKIALSNKNLARAFLRGLFDTDGCLKFSKQTKSIHY
jgi:DNA-binding transcriptional regulator WhiA